MPRGTAVIATHLLPNGHQFTKEDLDGLAAAYRARLQLDPFINFNHRFNRRPVAKATDVWVDSHPRDAGEFTLNISFETLADADPAEVASQFETGGFSISFFGFGIANTSHEEEQCDLIVGYSFELGLRENDLREVLEAITRDAAGARIAVRHYHQHAAEPVTTIVIVVSIWLLEKIGEKVFERTWSTLFKKRPHGKDPQLLRAHIRTSNGEYIVEMPVSDQTAVMQHALADTLREASRQNAGETAPGRVTVSYDEDYTPTVARLPGAAEDSQSARPDGA